MRYFFSLLRFWKDSNCDSSVDKSLFEIEMYCMYIGGQPFLNYNVSAKIRFQWTSTCDDDDHGLLIEK